MYLPGYTISSPYGWRWNHTDFHAGVDYATPIGVPLPALSDGVIQFAGDIPAAKPGFKREIIVVLQRSDTFVSWGHLSKLYVKAGDKIQRGQIIGLSGNTGWITAPHVHVEKRRGIKVSSKPFSDYLSTDITPELQAYGGTTEMTGYEIAKGIYEVLGHHNSHPAEAVLKDKGNNIDANGYGGLVTVMTDVRNAVPWIPKDEIDGDQQDEINEALVHLDTAEQILRDA